MPTKIRWVAVLLAALGLLPSRAGAQVEIRARSALITLGGRLHAQMAHTSAEGAPDFDFFIRRARLTVDARVNDFLSVRLQPEFDQGEVELKDAWVRLAFHPALRLSMGQFKRSFDPFELASSTDLPLAERDGRIPGLSACPGVGGICSYSRFTEKLGYADRDGGLGVDGELAAGRLSYGLSLTNGTGADERDENDGKSVAGRIRYALTDRIRLGGGVSVHDHPSPVDPEDGERATAWGADVEWGDFRDGLHLMAGVVGGDNWLVTDPDGGPAGFLTAQGLLSYHRPVAWDRLEAVEPLVRVSWGDPTRADDDSGLLVTPGLLFHVAGKNMIGANVDVYSPETGGTEYSLKIQSWLYF